jgi:hypothetical protein
MKLHGREDLSDIRFERYGTPKRPFRSICTFTKNIPIRGLISLYSCAKGQTSTQKTVRCPLLCKNYLTALSNLVQFFVYGTAKFEKTRFLPKKFFFKWDLLKNGSENFRLIDICYGTSCLLTISSFPTPPAPLGTEHWFFEVVHPKKDEKKCFFFKSKTSDWHAFSKIRDIRLLRIHNDNQCAQFDTCSYITDKVISRRNFSRKSSKKNDQLWRKFKRVTCVSQDPKCIEKLRRNRILQMYGVLMPKKIFFRPRNFSRKFFFSHSVPLRPSPRPLTLDPPTSPPRFRSRRVWRNNGTTVGSVVIPIFCFCTSRSDVTLTFSLCGEPEVNWPSGHLGHFPGAQDDALRWGRARGRIIAIEPKIGARTPSGGRGACPKWKTLAPRGAVTERNREKLKIV